MRKFAVLNSTIFLAIIIAGAFGIIHDQVTYSISPEYYTKFKFIQFGINEELQNRTGVGLVGFTATWWMGMLIGICFGLVGLIYSDHKRMFKEVMKAIGIVFCITVISGVIGFLYGRFYLVDKGVSWWLPDNLIDRASFISVGSIHNFSYIGCLVGLIAGIVYLIIRNRNMPSEQVVELETNIGEIPKLKA